MSVPRCNHRSHRGNPKQKYRSYEHAERTALNRGWEGATIYPCPTGQKHYHLATPLSRKVITSGQATTHHKEN